MLLLFTFILGIPPLLLTYKFVYHGEKAAAADGIQPKNRDRERKREKESPKLTTGEAVVEMGGRFAEAEAAAGVGRRL